MLFTKLFSMLLSVANAASVSYTMDLRNWVVDFQRPTIIPRVAPYAMPGNARMDALLANNSYPGPAVEAFEGDTIAVTIINNMIESQVDIQFNGVDMQKAPTAPILQQGGNATYTFVASKAGTFTWQASVPSQAARGLRGAIVVRSHKDPDASKYQEEKTIVLSDARQRPEVCIDPKGLLAAGCPEVEKASLNGQWGDDSKGFEKPIIEVTQGACYRLRFLGLVSTSTPVFNIAVQDHSVEILGKSTNSVSSFQVHAGEGVDAVLCANQHPTFFKDYAVTIDYVGQTQKTSLSAILRYGGNAMAVNEKVTQAVRSLAHQGDEFDRSQCDKDIVFDIRDKVVDYKWPAKNQAVVPLANKKSSFAGQRLLPWPCG